MNLQNILTADITQLKKNPSNPTEKWMEDLNRHFSKKRHTEGQKYMRRCSLSLIIGEMQIKSTVRYYLTSVRMAIFKQSTNNKF